ncbi:hypothetical protein VCRA217O17_20021 [Vibrio crassostreae]|nr:hypothetical protein VCRA2127O344_10400 [Vibrio crassostreae]CAK3827230.1 hypothetical protein VCRA217O17_20021 [Vibrio crassostreae]
MIVTPSLSTFFVFSFSLQLHSQNENNEALTSNYLLNKRLIPGTIFALYLFTRLRLVREGTE